MRRHSYLSVLIGFCLLAGGLVFSPPPAGADSGVLKLMVIDCDTENPIDAAEVDVIVWRPGVGQIDSDSGETEDGFVEFSFTGLQSDDEARVTVTPAEQDPDSSHTYYWVYPPKDPGMWDLGMLLDGFGDCTDGWWDKDNGIFQCAYKDSEGQP